MTQPKKTPESLTPPSKVDDNMTTPTKALWERGKKKENLRDESDREKRLFIEYLRAADPEVWNAHLDLARSMDRHAFSVPPLWAERSKDCDMSPSDWIVKHYGKKNEDGSWSCSGLTRSTLRDIDITLYRAFNKHLYRLRVNGDPIPEHFESLAELPSERVSKELAEANIIDPKDAYRVFPDDLPKADRVYHSAQRRLTKT